MYINVTFFTRVHNCCEASSSQQKSFLECCVIMFYNESKVQTMPAKAVRCRCYVIELQDLKRTPRAIADVKKRL